MSGLGQGKFFFSLAGVFWIGLSLLIDNVGM